MVKRNRRRWTRALVEPHNMQPPRSEDQKRADIPTSNGDIAMVSSKTIEEMFAGGGDTTGVMDVQGVEIFFTSQHDGKGGVLMHHVAIEAWKKQQACDGCHLVLGVHFIEVYTGSNAYVDLIIGDTNNYKHYHPECEPTDGAYKFKVEYKAITRKEVGSDTGIIPVSKFN